LSTSRSAWPAASWRRGLPIGALVLLLALLDALHTHAGYALEGNPRPWSATLGMTAVFWLVYAAFIPPIMWVADRCRLDPSRPHTVVVHVSAALAFTYVHILAISVLMAPFRPAPEPFVQLLGRLLRLNFGINVLTYWAIVGAMHAIRYRGEAQEREIATAQLQAGLAASRLQSLRAQLNPHFLFNALNAISVLALKRQHTAVVDTIARLGELLRVSLDDARPQQIPLTEEMRFLEGYLGLLRTRFGDRMVIDRQVPNDTLDALVPTMILQPVVENAIVHGIGARVGRGRIAIEARRDADRLRLTVSDNGPGFAALGAHDRGIGLSNTRARLEQIYGAAQSLDVGNAPEGGAVVTITIPFVGAGHLAIPA
jgi:two-component system LytT family sensor kinase